MTNLKQELASMEEKVAYQSYERARDIQVRPKTDPGAGGPHQAGDDGCLGMWHMGCGGDERAAVGHLLGGAGRVQPGGPARPEPLRAHPCRRPWSPA